MVETLVQRETPSDPAAAFEAAGSQSKNPQKTSHTSRSSKTANQGKPKKKIYSKFQYQDKIFKLGDVCRFFQEEGSSDLIGRIIAICSTDPKHPDFAKLKVRWYYQKKDLFKTKLTERQLAQIADDVELFGTNHYQNVYVQTINGRCELMSLPEFEALSETPPDTFFTRAEFDTKKKVFKPDYDRWETMCSCALPPNPLQAYIQCETCDSWFHPTCEDTKADVEHFVCKKCQKKQ